MTPLRSLFAALLLPLCATAAQAQEWKEIRFGVFLSPTSVITRKSADFGDTPESLKGKQVGVLQGSLQEAYARAHLAKLGAQVKAYQSQDQNYADLQNLPS